MGFDVLSARSIYLYWFPIRIWIRIGLDYGHICCLMFLSAVLCCQMSAIHNPLKIRDTYSFDYEFSDDPPKLPIAGTVFPVPHTL